MVRVKRNVLSRSIVGAFSASREIAGSSDFNRVYGVDGQFIFRRYFTIDTFLAKSADPKSKENWVLGASAKWDSDFLLLGMEYLSVDPDFRDDLGFVRRTDIRRFSPSLAFSPRPNIRGVQPVPHLRTVGHGAQPAEPTGP